MEHNPIAIGLKPLLDDTETLERVARNVENLLEGHIPDLASRSRDSNLFDFKGRVDPVIQHFSDSGLAREDYLRAAVRHPQLFCMKPATVIANIEGVVARFAADGLTHKDYVRAAVKQPSLFYQNPRTIISNLEETVTHFKSDGLTNKIYINCALKQPSLFYQKSDTIIGHANMVSDLHQKGLLLLPNATRGPPSGLSPVLDFLIKRPVFLCLADDNFVLREIAARVAQTPPSPSFLKRPRKEIERELAEALGQDNTDGAVAKLDTSAGHGPHARNLLLRALIREGYIQGNVR